MIPIPSGTDISFQWPLLLWTLVAVPLCVTLYFWMRRRAPVFAGLESTHPEERSGFLDALARVAPPILMLLALTCFLIALARPQAAVALPARARTVMLAMDVSGSMRAGDIKPDRITAARSAARQFIESMPLDAKIGLVSVAASASVAQSPTAKRQELFEALDRFQIQRGTALGSGIVLSLATLLPEAGIDAERHINGFSGRPPAPPQKSMEPGTNGALAIVLVSDGQSNTGPDPIKMARLAAEHGVRVHTVGIGTMEGAVLTAKGMSMRVRLDESQLKEIAQVTQGEYFQAASAAEMGKIYKTLSSKLSVDKKRPVEISGLLAGIGALLAVTAALITFIRVGRIL